MMVLKFTAEKTTGRNCRVTTANNIFIRELGAIVLLPNQDNSNFAS
jgi:hypothetical protein